MFERVLNRSGRSMLVLLFSLLWTGAVATNIGVAAQPGHGEAAAQPAKAAPAPHAAPDHAAGPVDGAADTHGAHGDAAKGPIEWKTDLALWTLIVFAIFVVILKVFAWGPLSGALNAREHKIKSDITHAEEARVKAEQMLAEYQTKLAAAQDEVLRTLAEARRDAEHARQEIMAQTERDVAATKERAIIEIERTKDQALEELFNHLAGTVANATERVLGRALTDADQERLIGDALAEFSRGQAS